MFTIACESETSASPTKVPSSKYTFTLPLFTVESCMHAKLMFIETLPAVLFNNAGSGSNVTLSFTTCNGPVKSLA